MKSILTDIKHWQIHSFHPRSQSILPISIISIFVHRLFHPNVFSINRTFPFVWRFFTFLNVSEFFNLLHVRKIILNNRQVCSSFLWSPFLAHWPISPKLSICFSWLSQLRIQQVGPILIGILLQKERYKRELAQRVLWKKYYSSVTFQNTKAQREYTFLFTGHTLSQNYNPSFLQQHPHNRI